jgi:hypothetical protein
MHICERAGGQRSGLPCSCNGDPVCGGAADTSCGVNGACIVDGTAWVGFTASTGDAFSVFEIFSWSFLNLAQEGSVFAFGGNVKGQLGLGDTRDRRTGNLVASLDGFVMVDAAAGGQHSLVLNQLGAVYAWGDNQFGQLGLGDLTARRSPTKVLALDAMRQSALAGDPCVCAAVASRGCQTQPRLKPCTFSVVAVVAGSRHSLAMVLRDSGAHEIWGWGDNSFGQLGCLELPSGVTCPWAPLPVGTRGNYPTAATIALPCSGTNVRCMALPRRITSFDRLGLQSMVMSPIQLVAGAFHNILITGECVGCPMPAVCSTQKLTRAQCECDGGERSRGPFVREWIIQDIPCIAKRHEVYTW